MAVFSVLNDTGINGNGIHFGSIGQISSSGLAGAPTVSATVIDVCFNDGGLLHVTGNGLGYTPPSDYTGYVDSITYSRPGGTAVFSITGFCEPLGDLAGLITGGDELAILADLFSENDAISGSCVADLLIGFGGNDILAGNGGDDTLRGGTGADVLIGGILNVTGGIGDIEPSGVDTADYSTSSARVAVLLYETGNLDIDILGVSLGLTGVTTGRGGDAEGDSLVGITNLTGSAFNDYLGGNADENTLAGGAGNDGLQGGAGADVLDGGAGVDMADYTTSNAAVHVDLAAGTASGGHAAGDTLTSIESLRGSAFNDTLTGDDGANRLSGIAGTDTLDGGAGNDKLIGGAGADVLIGGAGFDEAVYDNASAGVTASLANPSVNTGDAAGDTYSSIESLTGSAFADTLTGNSGSNYLIGWGGDDTLIGGGGADRLAGGRGADTFVFNAIGDSLAKRTVDRINDFSHSEGDKIDVSGITGGGGSFIGSAAFSRSAGEVRFIEGASETNVYIDANGDGWADVQIRLVGAITLAADDFVL